MMIPKSGININRSPKGQLIRKKKFEVKIKVEIKTIPAKPKNERLNNPITERVTSPRAKVKPIIAAGLANETG